MFLFLRFFHQFFKGNDLGINSLELADLVYECEEKFNIEIADDDLHNFNTVGDIVRYLEEKSK